MEGPKGGLKERRRGRETGLRRGLYEGGVSLTGA